MTGMKNKRGLLFFFYPNDSIPFVLSLSNPGILLHLGCSGFTQGMKVVLQEQETDSHSQL